MNISRLLKLNLVLALIAVGVSTQLVWHHYTLLNGEGAFHSFCSINSTFDCDAVNGSAWAEMGGVPISALALGFYLFLSGAFLVAALNVYWRREILVLTTAMTSFGLLFSLGMLFVSAFVLKTFCLFCSLLYIVAILMALFSWLSLKAFGPWRGSNRKRLLTLATTSLVVLLVSHLFTRAALYSPMPFDAQAFLVDFRSQPKISVEPGNSPRLGAANAPIQIVEFADFQCPMCARAAKTMHRLLKKYPGKFSLVFKNYPLDASCNPNIQHRMHPYACYAARAVVCANKQGRFEDVAVKIFENQTELTNEKILTWSEEIGLNRAQLQTCIDSEEAKQAVLTDIQLATTLSLPGTPTFYVNGKRVFGLITEDTMKAILSELGGS